MILLGVTLSAPPRGNQEDEDEWYSRISSRVAAASADHATRKIGLLDPASQIMGHYAPATSILPISFTLCPFRSKGVMALPH